MTIDNGLLLGAGGIVAGLLAGLLGIGGGTVLVPLLFTLRYAYDQAVATSVLAIVMTSLSGSIQNFRTGNLQLRRVFPLAFPAVVTALIGPRIVEAVSDSILEFAFGVLLLTNIYLTNLRRNLASQDHETDSKINPLVARLGTGAIAGFLAGIFGVGGGVIMVPFQILLLGEAIKVAIQTSLGVIVITAISACIGHALAGNVLWLEGVILGVGGLLGAQVSTRYLPKLPDRVVRICFYTLLVVLAGYFFWKALN
jgi:uncharacterized membrane protein YfcA